MWEAVSLEFGRPLWRQEDSPSLWDVEWQCLVTFCSELSWRWHENWSIFCEEPSDSLCSACERCLLFLECTFFLYLARLSPFWEQSAILLMFLLHLTTVVAGAWWVWNWNSSTVCMPLGCTQANSLVGSRLSPSSLESKSCLSCVWVELSVSDVKVELQLLGIVGCIDGTSELLVLVNCWDMAASLWFGGEKSQSLSLLRSTEFSYTFCSGLLTCTTLPGFFVLTEAFFPTPPPLFPLASDEDRQGWMAVGLFFGFLFPTPVNGRLPRRWCWTFFVCE